VGFSNLQVGSKGVGKWKSYGWVTIKIFTRKVAGRGESMRG